MGNLEIFYEYIRKCVVYDFSDAEVLENKETFKYSEELKSFEQFLNTLVKVRFKSEGLIYNFYYNSLNEKAVVLKEYINARNVDIGKTHLDFIAEIGEIIDFYNINDSSFLINVGHLFISNSFQTGLAEYQDDYLDKCKKDEISPDAELLKLKLLGLENNGNFIMYNGNDELFKYASDDIYRGLLVQVKNVPKQTFYKINGIDNISELLLYIRKMLE